MSCKFFLQSSINYYVKQLNYDGRGKSSVVILNFQILQDARQCSNTAEMR